jgi:hypothetical protein
MSTARLHDAVASVKTSISVAVTTMPRAADAHLIGIECIITQAAKKIDWTVDFDSWFAVILHPYMLRSISRRFSSTKAANWRGTLRLPLPSGFHLRQTKQGGNTCE